ncbi:MAG: carboxyl transferase domain-containing protein [Myxococcota bacterium]|nr:carboxyl transferase domain-containing protein [Myxococcota bacterium]
MSLPIEYHIGAGFMDAASFPQFTSVAILNRGEAAIRFMRAAATWSRIRKSPLKTYIFYTRAEQNSLFVRMADHAIQLDESGGDSGGRNCYLDIERILGAMGKYAIQAVWPGWGFLAESASMVRACEAAGIIFIGPTSDAVDTVGDKNRAKELALREHVPTLPGVRMSLEDVRGLTVLPEGMDFPIMLKASRGGGGRGIRKVLAMGEIPAAAEAIGCEIEGAFEAGEILIEKLVQNARHIEVQIAADAYGHVFALGTRDCSVQRRRQKVVEEAPAFQVEKALELRILEAALRVAKGVSYRNLGTVEFLVETDKKNFYFLEVNPRLQVEHTITEESLGIDLVCLQIDIAQGRNLEGWKPPSPVGHVIEVRLNAENPDSDFSPSTGKVLYYEPPQGPGIRVDSGYTTGDVIPADYDSNLAKVIAKGENREEALARMMTALEDSRMAIEGGPTNKTLLIRILNGLQDLGTPINTSWLENDFLPNQFVDDASDLAFALAATAIGDHLELRLMVMDSLFNSARTGLPGRTNQTGSSDFRYNRHGVNYNVTIGTLAPQLFRCVVDGVQYDVKTRSVGPKSMLLTDARGRQQLVTRVADPVASHIELTRNSYSFQRVTAGRVVAPISAMVTKVLVKEGTWVDVGDPVIVVEVMKSETMVRAVEGGEIANVMVKRGQHVGANDVLCTMHDSMRDVLDEEGASKKSNFIEGLGLFLKSPGAILKARLLGYDVDEPTVDQAMQALNDATLDGALLQDIFDLLETTNCQASLFRHDPLDDGRNKAGETSAEQLQYVLLTRDFAADSLSERFKEKLAGFVHLHGINAEGSPKLALASLSRLFLGFVKPEKYVSLLGIVLDKLDLVAPTLLPREARLKWRSILEVFGQRLIGDFPNVSSRAESLLLSLFDVPELALIASERRIALKAELGAHNAFPDFEWDTVGTEDLIHSVNNPDLNHRIRKQTLCALMNRYWGDDHCFRMSEDGVFGVWTLGDGTRILGVTGGVLKEWNPGPADKQEAVHGVECFGGKLDGKAIAEKVNMVFEGPVKWVNLHRVQGDSLTFARSDQGSLAHDLEVDESLAFHPSSLLHREKDYFNDFELSVLVQSQNLVIAKAVAKEDVADRRLIGLLEVDALDAERGPDGGIARIPNLEIKYLQMVSSFRACLMQLGLDESMFRDAYQWNRIVITIRPVVHLRRREIDKLVERLLPWTRDLGLERVVVKANFKNIGGTKAAVVPLMLEALNPSGVGARLRIRGQDAYRIGLQGDYEKKIARARRTRRMYPYSFIEQQLDEQFLPGFKGEEFVEYDVAPETTKLMCVANRPYGENQANLVFGTIRHTLKSSGRRIERVLIVSDPSRKMGALGQPECVRILAAFELARQKDLPIEWLAVSSGAEISFDSGTENLDWTARVLREIVLFTQSGGVVNVVVDGLCVGAQSYWISEATMLLHCKGSLVMTKAGALLLTGKRALEYSGSVSAGSNFAIGGFDRVLGPNGEAHYRAKDLGDAYSILFRHYEITLWADGHEYSKESESDDSLDRLWLEDDYEGDEEFQQVGEVFSEEHNPGRKRAFSIRTVMNSVLDRDWRSIERWKYHQGAENAVVLMAKLGGYPVCCIGVDARPLARRKDAPLDGPSVLSSGTLFPESSRKVARAISACSGQCPVVVLANLAGFDGSPESMRLRQLEYGAEIGRAVVNFQGPLIFCVVSRYHGGAYVVFSRFLNPQLHGIALQGSFASVIGGGAAAAVVFPREVHSRARARFHALVEEGHFTAAEMDAQFTNILKETELEVATEFDRIHSIERAKEVGSIDEIVAPSKLRKVLVGAIERDLGS